MKALVGLALLNILSVVACGQAARPASDAADPTPVSTKIPAPTSSPSPAFRPGTLGAVVTSIIDGDTVVVAFQDGSTDSVKLLGWTPETAHPNNPHEYGDITDTACLDDWGDAATKVTIQQLEDRVVTLVPDPVSGEQGSSGRMQAYIKLEGKDFNAALVKLGLSRMHTEGDSGRAADYSALQEWLKG